MSAAAPPDYASIKLTTRVLNAGFEPSTGSVSNSSDDALAENFRSVLKTDCVRHSTFATPTDASPYIDGWYNTHRRATGTGHRG
ncbi:hypothetical protein J5Y04_13950 [Kitasatospora sp. RG8]|uniref:hypothetical protein n=1 Tax=Kitasatospora sp. RG8 TaxID=2820815 RepID=UPI001ADF054B|nr:hypothetical protein [Kitasatospora sp. RG8]MBP0450640.1 hypothetical protein [Kitasatospora sp. RG8]